jgi:hypothetical protein
MRISPTGQTVVYDGKQVGKYGRDISDNETYVIIYQTGIGNEPMWGIDAAVEMKISVSVDTILIADEINGLHAIERETLLDHKRVLNGRKQYVVSDTNDGVHYVGEMNDHLQGSLWIESGNQIDEGYHKKRNES